MKQLFFLASLLISSFAIGQNVYNVIPEPVKLEQKNGNFTINAETKILIGDNIETLTIAQELISKINTVAKLSLKVVDAKQEKTKQNSILFLVSSDKVLGAEGYKLTVSEDKILIEANERKGFFNALQTIYQLLPPEIYGNTFVKGEKWTVPCCEIYDYPRFEYRGMHLDVCRHFFSVDFVKRYIDLLAMHKLNIFHWHLTDDQGWRIEIKKYPKLTEVGSNRSGTLIGHFSDNVIQKFDDIPYGGYYTQEQIRDIVNYAKNKNITVIPEIELPGHAVAALAAYPELSCTGGPFAVERTWGVFDDVFCPKETTFTFFENVLTEVMDLFPDSPYIHIGGDECPKTKWKTCPSCQARIKELGLKDEHELQSYFIGRISKFLISKGRKPIAWDEALEGGLPDDVIIMSWQGEKGGIEAAKLKHEVIMTPQSHSYYNHYQGDPANEPLAFGGFVPLQKVYNFDPIPKDLKPEEWKYIIGTQANMWTEYIATEKGIEYMLLPRLSALSEIAWSKKENKNLDYFLNKINEQFHRYDVLGVTYSKSHYNLKSTTTWNKEINKLQIQLQTACKECKIHYTLDGSEPSSKSPVMNNPITAPQGDITLKAAAFLEDVKSSETFTQTYVVSKSTGRNYILDNPNPQYPGGGGLALTDGVLSDATSWNKWIGILGVDLNVVVDLGATTDVKEVYLNYLNNPASWIFLPHNTTLSISNDGKSFEKISFKDLKDAYSEERKKVLVHFKLDKTVKARYVKISANAVKQCPKGHPGEGINAHLFLDEIVVK